MTVEPSPREPTKIVGRYALYGEIASGGMATVHIGRLLGPVGFARTVAIKRLHPQFARDPEFVSMFLDEARLAARVQHPNVVATIDVVATEGELFLIMDYIRGEPLSRLVRAAARRHERVPPRIVASIICGFLHGLHAAHEAKDEHGHPLGLIHRDVSPQNVLVGSDGVARVLDFGVAKAAGRVQVTRDGQIKGKLAYMPPEQLHSGELTRTVDVYASAVVLWEALTGERLFKGENEAETLKKIMRGRVDPPSHYVGGLPPAFDEVVLRGLGKIAGGRFTSAREMAMAVERCAGIASPTEVGEWVERIAGDVLAAREQHIAAMESDSTSLFGTDMFADVSDISAAMPPQGMPLPSMPPPSGNTPARRTVPVPKAMPLAASLADTLILEPAANPASMSHPEIDVVHDVTPTINELPMALRPTGRPQRTSLSISESIVIPGLARNSRRPYVVGAIAFAVIATFLAGGVGVGLYAQGPEKGPAGKPVGSPSSSLASTPIVVAPPHPVATVGEAPAPTGQSLPSALPVAAPVTSLALPDPTANAISTVAPAKRTPTATATPSSTVATPSSAAPAALSADCDPPFEVDAKGHKRYKMECLNK